MQLFFMPPPLKVGGAYRFAFVRPSVRLYVRPYFRTSVRTKKTSLCRAYLWNHCHYILQTSGIHCSGCELAHLDIFIHPFLSFTELWPLILWKFGPKSLCHAYLWNHRHYRLETSGIYCSGCELAHLGIFIHPLISFTELWPLILWKYGIFSLCRA